MNSTISVSHTEKFNGNTGNIQIANQLAMGDQIQKANEEKVDPYDIMVELAAAYGEEDIATEYSK